MNKLKALLLSVLLLSSMSFGQQDLNRQQALPWQTYYTPAALNVNALVEPGSGTTAVSNIVSTIGAKQVTIVGSCTQGPIQINFLTYDSDGVTVLSTLPVVTAITASTVFIYHIASELGPNVSGTGTLTATNAPYLPLRAFALSFTNSSATPGTCTARVFIAY